MAEAKITRRDADALLAFLPGFEAAESPFIDRWAGGESVGTDTFTMPYPEYPDRVRKFFALAASECWCDYEYDPELAGAMVADDERIAAAGLADIRTMLTYMVRGERFCDGHWGALLDNGRVQAVLRRLQVVADEGL